MIFEKMLIIFSKSLKAKHFNNHLLTTTKYYSPFVRLQLLNKPIKNILLIINYYQLVFLNIYIHVEFKIKFGLINQLIEKII